MQENNKPLYSLTVGEFKELLGDLTSFKLDESIAQKTKKVDDQLIKIAKLCEILKVSRVTVFNWIKNGKIKAYHLNSRLYFKMKDVEDALNSRRKDSHE
jgi:excisionase family DNA binding protein